MAWQLSIMKIHNNTMTNKYTAGVCLDLSKSFDPLLKTTEHHGIRGIANKWVENYLSNRKQFVSYNGAWTNLEKNCLWCSKRQYLFGPLLFILCANDITGISSLLDLILYADDTNFLWPMNLQQKHSQ